MKIFDCTMFFDENMMYDLRLNLLNEYVDKFVVVESLYTHRGNKKKQNFNINDYSQFSDLRRQATGIFTALIAGIAGINFAILSTCP